MHGTVRLVAAGVLCHHTEAVSSPSPAKHSELQETFLALDFGSVIYCVTLRESLNLPLSSLSVKQQR